MEGGKLENQENVTLYNNGITKSSSPVFLGHETSLQIACPKMKKQEPLWKLLAGKVCVGVAGVVEADPELEAIRQRRMQELMAQHGAGNNQNPDQQKAQDEAKREAEDRRQLMLSQILTSEARERVARIALVKPEKARGVEDVILRAAQFGQISEKVSEEKLIQLLEQINTQTTKQTKVTIQRRRSVLEDDD
nr:DNA-binding protein DDB_G0278111 [Ipomoea trifida]